MGEALTRSPCFRSLVVPAILVSVLLCSTAAPPAHADNHAPIFSWPGNVEVSTPTLTIREGEVASYNLWLSQQPSDDGWWVRIHVDGLVRYDAHDQSEGYKGITWTPSVGWEFDQDNSTLAVATQPRGVSIHAVQDADTDDEVIEFTHEVWDENSECPEDLHGVAKVIVKVIDDDRDSGDTLPSLSIQDAPVTEGGTAQFKVRLSPSSDQEVTVDYATADRTAVAGSDYTSKSGKLTFIAGQTMETISVPTINDRFHEPEERFRVTLSNPKSARLARSTGEGRISDNDLPELSIRNASVVEGGAVQFEVRLTPSSDQEVTVAYATEDDTAVGTDYTAKSGLLTFTPGRTTRTISVQTTHDTEQESDERFRVILSNPSRATLDDATGEGTIIDNDGGPDMPELSIGDASVEEGGIARFEVRLTPSSEQPVTVAYATVDVTASSDANTDYTSKTGTLSFPAGETLMTISVQTTHDTEQETDERFMVNLSNPSGAVLNDANGEGTIIDNDGDGGGDGNGGGNGGDGNGGGGNGGGGNGGGGNGGDGNGGGGNGGGGNGGDGGGGGGRQGPAFSIGDATVEEGDLAEFTVSLSNAGTRTVFVSYRTVDGTAKAGSDYTTRSGRLGFERGETKKKITVPIVEDDTAEATERFTVQLSIPFRATIANGTGTCRIIDDDGLPTLSINDASPVEEGQASSFEVRLSASSTVAVTVSYRTVDGTALAGSDYTAVSGTLRFEPGETTRTISVETLADDLVEEAEQFTVELSDPTGAMVTDGIGVGTINDAAVVPELELSIRCAGGERRRDGAIHRAAE